MSVGMRVGVGVRVMGAGTTVAGGLFIPSLLTGAAGGRLIGQLLNQGLPNHVVNAGIYSFIGMRWPAAPSPPPSPDPPSSP